MYKETHGMIRTCIYIMFFLSGAAALMYQVVWVRSLSLVFGGSHLAVTAVLSIFMAGLAIGGYIIGKHVDNVSKPLRLYGLLEIGIALFALVFAGLMKLYPAIYPVLAGGKDDAHLYLTVIRVLFSISALLAPTVLMGGTLPVLTRFISRHPAGLKRNLSFLYGLNTLGAVFGAAAAGFYLLRLFSVSATLLIAIIMNLAIGLVSILLQEKAIFTDAEKDLDARRVAPHNAEPQKPSAGRSQLIPLRLVLWGIGVSGFCALGYEVLWTRILTIVVGASVYSFTVLLIAFLTGIALGSKAYGLLPKSFGPDGGEDRQIAWFGFVQIIIGFTSLLVTILIRDLPTLSVQLLNLVPGSSMGFFGMKLWSNFLLAFLTMLVPAFFMGLAFPLAGTVHAAYRKRVGVAVGEVLAYNTVGAILGAAVSGFALIYLFGIERSLQMLTIVNTGFGLLVLASLLRRAWLNTTVAGTAAAVLLFLAANPDALRLWNAKYFAIFRNNQPEVFSTPEKVRDALENTDVLYYAEGVEAIVSSIKVKGGGQSFITNGRIEAAADVQGQQHLYVLGHLPMLLHKDPRKVLVVGMGSGMTLGATSAHPGVEQITLAEIEPKVIGVARTFEAYNHRVLDDPRLRIVFNDGRNFLMTTKGRFDVITADPIHPWFRGAGYLYTTEYFKLAAEHLAPGGIICQWLPLYELTPENIRSVVRTFNENFRYTMLWLTHNDAEIVGSNEPIRIDEAELEHRIAEPAVAADLKRVMMGTSAEFLSYFALGTEGMRAFGRDGILNTDDNLYLEFSAPLSIRRASLMAENVRVLLRHREPVIPYLVPAAPSVVRAAQLKRWANAEQPIRMADEALALYLGGAQETPRFEQLMKGLKTDYPQFAPARFLREAYLESSPGKPFLLGRTVYPLLTNTGATSLLEISAVLVPVSRERVSVMFVDNAARVIYGELYVSGADREDFIRRFADEVLTSVNSAYEQMTRTAPGRGSVLPSAEPTKRMIKDIITRKVQERREL